MNVLASVHEKKGLFEFLGAIRERLGTVVASEGTAAYLEQKGIPCLRVGAITGFSDLFSGRIKTLHPGIYAGILNPGDEPDDTMKRNGYMNFDIVISNLYPFAEAALSGDLDRMIENIDIGGVSLTRAAAKNYRRVAVLTDPADYDSVSGEITSTGTLSHETRERLAMKAFATTSGYESLIYNKLAEVTGKPVAGYFSISRSDGRKLRYGENPDQSAEVFPDGSALGIPAAFQLSGKELSYNNIMDANAAMESVFDLEGPSCVIVKHNIPCGAASAQSLREAFVKALDSDRESAFGSVVCVNGEIDMPTAEEMSNLFLEVVCAPGYRDNAYHLMRKKKNLRLLKFRYGKDDSMRIRSISHGILVQSPLTPEYEKLECVTKVSADPSLLADLGFAWKVAARCRSNAIVLAKNLATVGVGAGQTSRIESLRIAARRAGERSRGSVLASDGYFPFSDSVKLAHEIGVAAIIQPGGSIRDKESISAADELGIPMYFTGKRTFLH